MEKQIATAEQRKQILKLHNGGTKFSAIVETVGLPSGTVDRVIDTDRGTMRVKSVGLEPVSEQVAFWLGQPQTADFLHDAPFTALAGLAVAAKLTWAEYKPVADAALASRTDESAVAAVTVVAEGMTERIAAVKAGKWTPTVTKKSAVETVAARVSLLSEHDLEVLRAALAQRDEGKGESEAK